MNKKQFKFQLLAAYLAVIMLFSAVPSVSAADETPTIDELIAGQAQAVAANEVLMQYFLDNGWVFEYPEYFGGCYIADNILHIRLIASENQEINALYSLLGSYQEVVVYEYGQYSQTDLQEYADATAIELREQGCEVTHWYVDSITGNIVIGVMSDDVGLANVLIEEQQTYALGNTAPEIIIEEGAYTTTTATDLVVTGGSIITTLEHLPVPLEPAVTMKEGTRLLPVVTETLQ